MSTNGQIMLEAAHLMAADVARGKVLNKAERIRMEKTWLYLNRAVVAMPFDINSQELEDRINATWDRWRAQAEKKG